MSLYYDLAKDIAWKIMQINASVLTVVCVLLSLAFNCTFPLHRDIKWHLVDGSSNHTHYCGLNPDNILNRTENIANNIGNAMKTIKKSVQDKYQNNNDKNNLTDKGLRHYERLVMMKKYPYLDINLDLKYSPLSNKNTRQSVKLEHGRGFGDLSLREAGEDCINVEINNRGLSGFFIPLKFVTRTENKLKSSELKISEPKSEAKMDIAQKSPERDVLNSLQDDILAYKEKGFK